MEAKHKAGFVNIVGNPNVGKSTMMNFLVGERLSIITSKAQTTRHRIMGIVNGADFQIVYSDTPGILQPAYKMQEVLMNFVNSAIKDADVFVYVVEVGEKNHSQEIIDKIIDSKIPIILVVNKIDGKSDEVISETKEYWTTLMPEATYFETSALLGLNIEAVRDKIIELLPESPAYFPKDELTDKPMRFFISEIIREKILLNYKKEIPYSVEVAVESYLEEDNITRITALIFTERESQKAILIGHKGEAIKRVGTQARQDIEAFIGKKVFLEIRIKVIKDWRNDNLTLSRFGYIC
ncbi:MAG: GTPase Era [Bacteroidota bacterium]